MAFSPKTLLLQLPITLEMGTLHAALKRGSQSLSGIEHVPHRITEEADSRHKRSES